MNLVNSNTETFSSEVAQGLVAYTFWNNIAKVFATLSALLIIYLLTVYEYGVYKLVFAFVGIAQIFEFSGFDSVISNDIIRASGVKNERKAATIFFEFAIVKICLSVAIFLIVFGGVDYYLSYQDHSAVALIKIAALVLIIFPLINIVKEVFRVRADFVALYKFEAVKEFVKLILLVGGVFFFRYSTKSIIWILILSYLIAIFPFLIKAISEIRGWKVFVNRDILRFREVVFILREHGKWAVANNIFSNFAGNIKLWLIKFFISTEAVAIFSVAQSFVGHLDSLLGGQRILGTLSSREWANRERTGRIYIRGMKYITLLSIVTGVFGLVSVTTIVNWFYPAYIQSLPLFYILLIPFAYYGLPIMTNTFLNTAREQKFLFWQAVYKTISIVTLNVLLLPLIGLYGMAIETVLTGMILTTSRYFKLRKISPHFSLNFKELFIFDEYDRSSLRQLKLYLIWRLGILRKKVLKI